MNVILVMLDTLRADHVGCYGNNWIRTPNLDRFAQDSMLFERVIAESLPTLPVRRALLTGMRVFPYDKPFYPTPQEASLAGTGTFMGIPRANNPGWEPIPWDQPTLAEMLTGLQFAVLRRAQAQALGLKAGYRTTFITDNAPYFQVGMNYQRGFDHWDFVRGQEIDKYGVAALANKLDLARYIPDWFKDTWEAGHLRRHLANSTKWQTEADCFGPQTFVRAMEWLDDSRADPDQFFLFVDCWDPHEPWNPPQKYVDLYDPGYEGIEMMTPYYGPTDLMTDAEIRHMRALYAGEVTMVDAWFGKFMNKVRDLGLLANSLIIVVSDHGMLLGERGWSGKVPEQLHPELTDSILMIRHPDGIGAGRRSRALVQHQDICTTVLKLAGVKPPYELDGQDLSPILEGKRDKVRDYVTCGFVLNVLCRDDEYAFISRTKGERPQLYDLKNDPEHRDNIAADRPQIVKRMFDLVMQDAHGQPVLPNFEPRLESWRCYRDLAPASS